MLGLRLDDFYDMTPREFFGALKGYHEHEADKMTAQKRLLLEAIRFNAQAIAGSMSTKQAKAIGNVKFDWEKAQNLDANGNPQPISYDSFKGTLEGLAKKDDTSHNNTDTKDKGVETPQD